MGIKYEVKLFLDNLLRINSLICRYVFLRKVFWGKEGVVEIELHSYSLCKKYILFFSRIKVNRYKHTTPLNFI